MKVGEIHFTENFYQQFKSLPREIQKKGIRAEELFKSNPFYPSLRLHKLKGKLDGLWSISLDLKYRIIFKPMEDGVVLFISIGKHAIYEGF